MSQSTEPVLKWLRDLIEKRGLNTAGLSAKCGIPKARLRRVLTGGEPMHVGELVAISGALDLSPTDIGLPPGADLPEDPAIPLSAAGPLIPTVDAWGNHIEQLFKVAFGLGVDFMFLSDPEALADSGVPKSVLDRHAGQLLPLHLKAEYHGYNEPTYQQDGISLVLSFDALFTCRFPWSSIRQFVFFPVAPEKSEEPESQGPARSHLRLVE